MTLHVGGSPVTFPLSRASLLSQAHNPALYAAWVTHNLIKKARDCLISCLPACHLSSSSSEPQQCQHQTLQDAIANSSPSNLTSPKTKHHHKNKPISSPCLVVVTPTTALAPTARYARNDPHFPLRLQAQLLTLRCDLRATTTAPVIMVTVPTLTTTRTGQFG